MWTAPEVFVNNTIPIESDLYTFGILLWELFTLGGMPHEQFIFIQEVEEEEINVVVKKGKRMNKPSFAPREIYELIKALCNFDPNLRPPLKHCKRNIDKYLEEACPPLALCLDIADASQKSDRNIQIHKASSVKIPQRKDKVFPQSLANDDNDNPARKEKDQPNCFTRKYRRNIILISAVIFFMFAAISGAAIILFKKSPVGSPNDNFNVTSTVISTDGSTSSASETRASINTATTFLFITTADQQKPEPTSAESPTSPKPTTTSTVTSTITKPTTTSTVTCSGQSTGNKFTETNRDDTFYALSIIILSQQQPN
uniref:Protein kinase domain-containing protein n=1 Tax=Plectus sambesii TaxID=2011161 RepID=A0A914WC25_9BILA